MKFIEIRHDECCDVFFEVVPFKIKEEWHKYKGIINKLNETAKYLFSRTQPEWGKRNIPSGMLMTPTHYGFVRHLIECGFIEDIDVAKSHDITNF